MGRPPGRPPREILQLPPVIEYPDEVAYASTMRTLGDLAREHKDNAELEAAISHICHLVGELSRSFGRIEDDMREIVIRAAKAEL